MNDKFTTRRSFFQILLLLLILVSSGLFAVKTSFAAKPPSLIGTMEFKGSLKKLPKWSRVLKKMSAWQNYLNDPAMKGSAKKDWSIIKQKALAAKEFDRLKLINVFFNRWPYRLDRDNYKVPDYWAIPSQFLKKSGDCEDYSIAKFYALKEVGISPDSMRVVAVKDSIRNIGHAILAVYIGDKIYILDNQTNMVLPATKYKHYIPQYSVNEKFRWMHVPAKKK